MKTLRYLLVGGVLTLGAAMAKETPKPATSPAVKKHHPKGWLLPLHKKSAKTTATPPAKAAPVTVAHKK